MRLLRARTLVGGADAGIWVLRIDGTGHDGGGGGGGGGCKWMEGAEEMI